jgi:hypothetical protein
VTSPERAVRQFRRDLGLLFFAGLALRCLTAWAFLWGTAVIVLRAAAGLERGSLLWGLLGLPLALVPAAILAWRRLPGEAPIRALLDRHGGCGGLLMAGAECSLGAWQEALPEVAPPPLRWRARRAWGLGGTAGAFLLAAFLVPQRLVQAGGPRLDVGRETEKLARQIEVLREETLLDATRAEALKQKLEQVKEQARGRNPARTLEALDHLEHVTSQTAKAAAEATARKTARMARAEAATEALRKAGAKMEEAWQTRAMEELAALTQKALEENDLLRKKLEKEDVHLTDEAGKAFDPDMLKRLSRALKGGKDDLKKRLERLKKEGLLDPEDLNKCEGEGDYDLDALVDFLEKGGGGKSLEEMLAECKAGTKPGRGGVTRGPGAAEITFGKETAEAGAKFKEVALPPPALAKLKQNRLIGLSPSEPEKRGGEAASGALDGAQAGGGSASTPVVLPRHRAAVQRYFDRPGGK